MQEKSSRIAVIDIGTNTCILLIAELVNGKTVTVFETFDTPRLGEGLEVSGEISKEATARVSKTLRNFETLSRKYNCDRIFAFGTYTLRNARNSKQVISDLNQKFDSGIEIISTEMEARCSYYGATFDFPFSHDYAVIDIGGGSTEFGYLFDDLFYYKSLNIGAVTLKDKFFSDGKFGREKVKQAVDLLNDEFMKINFINLYNKDLIRVAGTPVTYYALINNMKNFKEDKIHGKTLETFQISSMINILSKKDTTQIRTMGDFMKGRADIIVPGGLILNEFMKYFGFNEIKISTKGLRYGVFFYLLKN